MTGKNSSILILHQSTIGTKSMQNNISKGRAKIIWQPWSQSDPSGNLNFIQHSEKLDILIYFNNSVVTFKICRSSMTSRQRHFVVGFSNKKAESYHSRLPLFHTNKFNQFCYNKTGLALFIDCQNWGFIFGQNWWSGPICKDFSMILKINPDAIFPSKN